MFIGVLVEMHKHCHSGQHNARKNGHDNNQCQIQIRHGKVKGPRLISFVYYQIISCDEIRMIYRTGYTFVRPVVFSWRSHSKRFGYPLPTAH